MWRVNSKGEFNVPLGSAEKPAICQPAVLRACHWALQGVTIRQRDFRELDAGAGDFVYCDPPYHPLAGGSFTDYAKDGFGESEQIALRDLCLVLCRRGVKLMLSNSDTKFIRALYADAAFTIETVKAPRMVNRNPNQRGAVNELLIRNYEEYTNGE